MRNYLALTNALAPECQSLLHPNQGSGVISPMRFSNTHAPLHRATVNWVIVIPLSTQMVTVKLRIENRRHLHVDAEADQKVTSIVSRGARRICDADHTIAIFSIQIQNFFVVYERSTDFPRAAHSNREP